MRHITAVILLVAVISLTLLTSACTSDTLGHLIFNDTPTEIQKGFSPELLSTLSEQYQISIPDDVEFVKGINTNAFRDPSVVVLFECPIKNYTPPADDSGYSYVFQTLKLDESRYAFDGFDEEIKAYEELGGELDYRIVDNSDPFTYLSYSFKDDKLLVRFVGRHPGARFN